MKFNVIVPFLNSSPFKSVIFHLRSLRYNKGQLRALQEKNRILLRSVACRYLLKTYFGKGHFYWEDSYAVYKKCFKLLDRYPKPCFISNFQETKRGALIAKMRLVTPEERLDELVAVPNDSQDILEAKREALLCFIYEKFERMVADRTPNYREVYDPNNYEPRPDNPNFLSRTIGADFMRHVMSHVIDNLKTHQDHCDPQVWKTLRLLVIEPELPFNVELPD